MANSKYDTSWTMVHSTNHIRWYHWLVYRLFRATWNPVLRRSPGICKGLGMALIEYHDSAESGKAGG